MSRRANVQVRSDQDSQAAGVERAESWGGAELLESLINSSVDGILAFDRSCCYTVWNSAMEALSGMRRADVVGKNAFEVFPFLKESGEDRYFYDALEGKSVVSYDRPYVVQQSGRAGLFEGHYSPLFDASGTIIGGLAIIRDVSERRQLEARLLNAIIEGTSDIVFVKDRQGRYVMINSAGVRAIGRSHEEVIGRDDTQLFPPELCQAILARDREVLTSGTSQTYETTMTIAGVPRTFIATKGPYRDHEGNVIGLIGISHDITDRKQAEEESLRLARHLRLLLESTGEGIYGVDLAGCCTFINRSAAEVLGYTPEEMIGRNLHALIHHSHRDGSPYPEEECPISRSFLTGQSYRLEDEVLWRRDGTYFPVEYSSYPLKQDGTITGAVVIFVDITVRKRAEEERARLLVREQQARAVAELRQKRMAFLAEASALLASSLDYETTLARVAHLAVHEIADWCSIHLREEDGTIYRYAIAHADPARQRLIQALQQRRWLDPGQPNLVLRVLHSGQPELLLDIADPLAAEALLGEEQREIAGALGVRSAMIVPMIARGRVLGALTFASAEAGRRYGPDELALAEALAQRAATAVDNARLYREAQEAIHAREAFLSIASHELKTPLTSMLGYAELLRRRTRRDGTLPERDQRALEVIAEQGARLNKLVVALLDLSRIQMGQLSIEHGPVDLTALARRVVAETQPALEQHTIALSSPDEPLIVDGDELRLEQVLQNLIGNAIKYSPAGGPVGVRLERRGARACIMVVDRGIGIPQDALPQLFQRFYRAPNVDARQISGLGIGLFVIKEIVALHGGEIGVTSREGQGSTFTVCLPLLADER